MMRLAVLLCVAILMVGCSDEEKPADSTRPIWGATWSFTTGNELTDNSISTQANWTTALSTETNYNFTPFEALQNYVPSDASLNWLDDNELARTAGDFLRQFYSNSGAGVFNPDKTSFFFGVNTPMFTPANAYGVTIPKGLTPDVSGVALSLIFKTKIHSVGSLTPEQKWRATQHVTVHELGHARGLNAVDVDYDHNTHNGSNADICVMRNAALSSIPFSHVFCGYHRKVLRECLTIVKREYVPNDACASFP
jgi:hypothetical protein